MDGFYVYAMVSQIDGRAYVGMATDPPKRLNEHNRGKTKSTKAHVPWKIFFTEFCGSSLDARKMEKYYKRNCLCQSIWIFFSIKLSR